MKRYFIILFCFCQFLFVTAADNENSNTPNSSATTNVTGNIDSVRTFDTTYMHLLTTEDRAESDTVIYIQDANNHVLAIYNDGKIEKPWYDNQWIVIGAFALLIINLILAIYSLLGDVDATKFKEEIIDEVIRKHGSQISHSQGQETKTTQQKNSITKEEVTEIVNKLVDKKITELMPTPPVKEPEPAKLEKVAGQKQVPNNANRSIQIFAEAANDGKSLQNLTNELDEYYDLFEITLKQANDTEGEVRVINNAKAQGRLLKNTALREYCIIIGTGDSIVKQEPGRVRITGDRATIEEKPKIYLS